MARKPAHLNLNNNALSQPLMPPRSPSNLDLPSPRVGEQIALSPLDALAMRSRLLTKKFEEPAENGRRISRLPYTDVAREFAHRPDYFPGVKKGMQGGMEDVPEETSPTNLHATSNLLVAGGNEKDRPMSHYPMFGNAGNERSVSRQSGTTPFYDAVEELVEKEQPRSQDYFGLGAPRAHSPEPVDHRMVNVQAASPTNMPSLTNSVDSLQSTQTRTATGSSTRSQRALAPPRSPAYPKSPRSMQSIRSVPPDSGDEDGPFQGSQAASSSRKFSGSSGMSRPQSPFSPYMPPMPRSPSMSSEFSMTGSQRRMNFSRPLSSNSTRPHAESRPSFDSRSSFETRPSTELPHRHPSAASQSTVPSSGLPSRQPSQDDAGVVRDDDGAGDEVDEDGRPKTSYTYSKFTLPRGTKVERGSRGTRESWIRKQFTWDDNVAPAAQQTTPEEPIQEHEAVQEEQPHVEGQQPPPPPLAEPSPSMDMRPSLDPPPSLYQSPDRPSSQTGSERQSRFGRDRAMSRTSRSNSAEPRTLYKAAALHKSTPSVRTHGTDSTDRTIRAAARSLHERVPSAELTAEEHLEIGIQTHSNGELNKSTYHLRIAAREGNPTGMLLYALACRHGWGMRPNQEEGVRWLKKAIDGAGLQVADVEATLTSAAATTPATDPVAQAQERKKRKAQFALAIYELGISYMNGWGCDKDRPLALQCYEVAGSWGDCDALAEAGFCYAKGMGCKKDLKKAAALYRKAAEGGMSMAGNSWIYKPKYMDDEDSARGAKKDQRDVDASVASISSKEKDGKTGGRARSRSIWGRSKK